MLTLSEAAQTVAFHARRLAIFAFPVYIDLASFPSDVILVLGTARSGTTWVGNVIARICGSRTVFEPFVMLANRSGFATAPYTPETLLNRSLQAYLPDEDVESPLVPQIERILRGQVRSWWTEMEAYPGVFRTRLIKDVRANLMSGYLSARWPSLRIVYVLRDPVAVVCSQLAMVARGWKFDWQADSIVGNDMGIQSLLSPYRACLRDRPSLVERLATRWCIETRVAMRALTNRPNVCMATYRELAGGATAWTNVCKLLADHVRAPDQLLACIQRRAFTDRARTGTASSSSDFANERDAILRIVNEFGMEREALALE
jgi:hypothetical protein